MNEFRTCLLLCRDLLSYLASCDRYAKRLKEQGKLIDLKEYDTSHVGLLPGISAGGPADGSLGWAAKVLVEYLDK